MEAAKKGWDDVKECKCKGCKNRCVGCHSNCEDYIEYSEELKAKREKIANEKHKQDLIIDTKRKCVNRMVKKKK